MCYVLDQPFEYQNSTLEKKMAVHLSGIQMAFEYRTIWHPTTFRPFEYRTSSVLRSPLYLRPVLRTVQECFYLVKCDIYFWWECKHFFWLHQVALLDFSYQSFAQA